MLCGYTKRQSLGNKAKGGERDCVTPKNICPKLCKENKPGYPIQTRHHTQSIMVTEYIKKLRNLTWWGFLE